MSALAGARFSVPTILGTSEAMDGYAGVHSSVPTKPTAATTTSGAWLAVAARARLQTSCAVTATTSIRRPSVRSMTTPATPEKSMNGTTRMSAPTPAHAADPVRSKRLTDTTIELAPMLAAPHA